MASPVRSTAGQATNAFVSWLVTGAVGPALVALPVNLAADKLAGAAVRWFKRLRQTDDLSRLVRAAADTSVQLSRAEIKDLRELLEQEQTWRLLAAGKLNEKLQDLTGQIAACLPARDGRTAEDARKAASGIARGLLEFALFDLQPEVFQKVVLARLQQMSDQAGALDEALFRLHKDLYVFAEDAKDLFRQVMDRLPPSRADLGEVRIYLAALIDWLNTDPWPQDPRLSGPRLAPAAIERKLQVAPIGPSLKEDTDADDLTRRCSRLVILGGPGSGKTWLAMRTARICAERALTALENMTLDEVELPLYTTCSRLVSATGHIREATVASAIEWIGDLGGSRIVQALRLFFTDRKDEPTLLVIDSLDEAGDSDTARSRLRQVGSLQPPWRIVLTSRPSSWSNQLNPDDASQDQRVGELQPLRYPDDVESVIRHWFADRPEQGKALAAQIARRPSLQRAATVPLILAFYCILGGQQLPESRHKLYGQVVNRMLYAPWRPGSNHPPDPETCRAVLRRWAWKGAQKNHPVSGVGQWEDDIPTQQAELSAAGQAAVDHIAAPRGGPDFDTGETWRRFVHRSIREHLVAEHVALTMSAQEAADELVNHLWYDPDWEYAAPAALAMHPKRDQVLKDLICRAVGSDQLPADLPAIDGCREIRRFLARAAQDSAEGDWLPWAAQMIRQARQDLAASPSDEPLRLVAREVMASEWPTTTGLIIDALLNLLARTMRPRAAQEVAEAVGGLDASGKDLARAREALLGLLASTTSPGMAEDLAEAVSRLHPTAEDRARARQALLGLLARTTSRWEAEWLTRAITGLAVTAEDRAGSRETLLGLLACTTDAEAARVLAEAVGGLHPPAEDRARARQALLGLLARTTYPGPPRILAEAVTGLAVTAEDRARTRGALLGLLASTTSLFTADDVATAIIRLDPPAEDRARARQALLGLLAGTTNSLAIRGLAAAVTGLAVTAEDQAGAREALLNMLARTTDPWAAEALAQAMGGLDPPAEDQARARAALLGLLARITDPFAAARLAVAVGEMDPPATDRARARQALLEVLARTTDAEAARVLAVAVGGLHPPAEDRARARQALLEMLARTADAYKAHKLAEAVTGLAVTAEERARARETLFELLASTTDPWMASLLAAATDELDPPAEDRARARQALLEVLARTTTTDAARVLAEAVGGLDPPAEDRARARQALLGLLARTTSPFAAEDLVEAIIRLDPSVGDREALLESARTSEAETAQKLAVAVGGLDPPAEDRARAREALLEVLARTTDPFAAGRLAGAVAWLVVTAEERLQVRQALLEVLARTTNAKAAEYLTAAVAWLDPPAEDQARARQALLRLLARTTGFMPADELAEAVIALNPTVADLDESDTWPIPPAPALLAAARVNTRLPAWLAALSHLSRSARTAAESDRTSAMPKSG